MRKMKEWELLGLPLYLTICLCGLRILSLFRCMTSSPLSFHELKLPLSSRSRCSIISTVKEVEAHQKFVTSRRPPDHYPRVTVPWKNPRTQTRLRGSILQNNLQGRGAVHRPSQSAAIFLKMSLGEPKSSLIELEMIDLLLNETRQSAPFDGKGI